MILLRVLPALMLLLGFAITPARAQTGVLLQIIPERALLRAQPSLLAASVAEVMRGERLPVLERSMDNGWLKVGSPGSAGWLPRELGDVIGNLSDVPATASAGNSAGGGGAMAMPAYIPAMSARALQLYQRGLAAGRDPGMFTVVGDCNSEPAVYLGRLATGRFTLPTDQTHLQGIIGRYSRSFSRNSLAARGGYGTGPMFDPAWSDPFFCMVKDGEGPFPCEVRFSNASIVFVELGTGDQYAWQAFETNYRALIEHAISVNALPVLVTKADDLEAAAGAPSGHINNVIRRLAASTQMPLLDFAAAAKYLDNDGLREEPGPDFHLSEAGENLHLLTTLQTLHALAYGISGVAAVSKAMPSTPAPAPPATVAAPAAPVTAAATARRFVLQSQANIRASAGTTAAIIGSAQPGQALRLIEQNADGSWVQVDLAGAAAAWIYAALGRIEDAVGTAVAGNTPAPPTAAPAPGPISTVANTAARTGGFTLRSNANLRAGPGTNNAIIGAAQEGDSLEIIETSTDQAWLRSASGAWVYAALGSFASASAASVAPATSTNNGAAKFTVSVAAANIRNAPNAGAALLGRALRGETFDILDHSPDRTWVRIGEDRWVFVG